MKKVFLLIATFVILIGNFCSAIAPKNIIKLSDAIHDVAPFEQSVLSNLSINIIRLSILLIVALLITIFILKLKNKLSHNMVIISSFITVLIIFGCIVGVNRENKIKVYDSALEARPVIIRIFDFSQW